MRLVKSFHILHQCQHPWPGLHSCRMLFRFHAWRRSLSHPQVFLLQQPRPKFREKLVCVFHKTVNLVFCTWMNSNCICKVMRYESSTCNSPLSSHCDCQITPNLKQKCKDFISDCLTVCTFQPFIDLPYL